MAQKHVICGYDIFRLLDENGICYEYDAAFAPLRFEQVNEYAERIGKNSLYIHRRRRTGPRSMQLALENGAAGCITDQRIPTSLPCLYTESVYKAAAVISRAFYNDIANQIEQVCIIGTKGKTTTSRMLHAILSAADQRPAAFCTTNCSFDGKTKEHFAGTVSDPTVYYPLCEQALENGCRHMVSEMPSYAELCSRLTGIRFRYGIFTNLDHDHVSPYGHRSFENYVACKKKMLSRCRNVLLNLDDPGIDEFLEAAQNARSRMTFSLKGDVRADFRVHDIRRWRQGHAFTVETPSREMEMMISMPGIFNVSNALAAISQAWNMGVSPDTIREAIRDIHVEGRMMAYEHNGYLAFVDYAHNGISFRAVMDSLRTDYPDRKIVVVSGIGGRVSEYCHEDVARVIALYADHCIVTTDNPLDEDPAALCHDLKNRIERNGGTARILPDRTDAIRQAVEELKKDEVLLVTGKGVDREMNFFDHLEPYEGDDVLTQRFIRDK